MNNTELAAKRLAFIRKEIERNPRLGAWDELGTEKEYIYCFYPRASKLADDMKNKKDIEEGRRLYVKENGVIRVVI